MPNNRANVNEVASRLRIIIKMWCRWFMAVINVIKVAKISKVSTKIAVL